METRIEKDYGTLILKDGKIFNYEGGFTGNGWVYKDEEAYKTGKGICYISECGLNDLEDAIDLLNEKRAKSLVSEDEYWAKRADILEHAGYTRDDFLKIVGGPEFIDIADDIFYEADWAFPETYFMELTY